MKKIVRLGLALILCAIPTVAMAQATGGTIAGMVFDESNAGVPGATVTIRQTETDARRVLVTDEQGRYSAPALEPGTYEITAELSGFQTTVRRGVTLSLGQTLAVNVTMKVGGLETRVVVTEQLSMVETTKSGVAALVDQTQIRELPLNGRDFSQLALLQTGVLATRTTSRSVDRGMGTQVAVAGARPNQISYLLDGTDVTPRATSHRARGRRDARRRAVREFQILVNSYSAEYGRSAGGIVSAVTRSGTNTLHGAGFEFHRNDAFDSKTFFDPPTRPNPPSRVTSMAATRAGRSSGTACSSSAATRVYGRI